jgi:serine-type D-Ala-D-Ala carboxypeptidase
MISRSCLLASLSSLLLTLAADPTRLPDSTPAEAGMDAAKLTLIEPAVRAAIEDKQLPGAVILVARRGKIVYRQAFGQRVVDPLPEPMTPDTIFDLASLTKPIATATSVMLLVEQGKLRLDDTVAKYRPRFAEHSKEKITIEQLLLHTSGLIADNPLRDYADGREKALERIDAIKLSAAPGSKFTYSDLNYILLGELVEQIGGMPLDRFAAKHIFEPLRMLETGFKPAARLTSRIAPTDKRDDAWLRGEVHDPRAAKLGGVAGHAGLFGTADDLALFVHMLLNGGELNGRRILKKETVAMMTQPRPVPGGQRAYGWDVQTGHSANRGERFPIGKSFGHTGFTGTSIWIDPTSQTAVIFLSNRLHPDGKGNVNRLRGQVATIVAEAIQ